MFVIEESKEICAQVETSGHKAEDYWEGLEIWFCAPTAGGRIAMTRSFSQLGKLRDLALWKIILMYALILPIIQIASKETAFKWEQWIDRETNK